MIFDSNSPEKTNAKYQEKERRKSNEQYYIYMRNVRMKTRGRNKVMVYGRMEDAFDSCFSYTLHKRLSWQQKEVENEFADFA